MAGVSVANSSLWKNRTPAIPYSKLGSSFQPNPRGFWSDWRQPGKQLPPEYTWRRLHRAAIEPPNGGLPENNRKLYVAAAAEAACSKTVTARPTSATPKTSRGAFVPASSPQYP